MQSRSKQGANELVQGIHKMAAAAPQWVASAKDFLNGPEDLGFPTGSVQMEIEEEDDDQAPSLLGLASSQNAHTDIRRWSQKSKGAACLNWLKAVQLTLKAALAIFAVCVIVMLVVQFFFEGTELQDSLEEASEEPARGPFYINIGRNNTDDEWAEDEGVMNNPLVIVFDIGAGLSSAQRTKLGLLPAPLSLADFERARSGRRQGDTSRFKNVILKAGHGQPISILAVGTRSTAGVQCCEGLSCTFGDPVARACAWPSRFGAWLTNTYAPAHTEITVHVQSVDDIQMKDLMFQLDNVPLTGDTPHTEGGSIYGGEWDPSQFDLVILDMSNFDMQTFRISSQWPDAEVQVAGLAKRALGLKKHPAVLYLNTVQPFQNGQVEVWPAQEKLEGVVINALEPLGVPVVSYVQAVKPYFEAPLSEHRHGSKLPAPYWGGHYAGPGAHQLLADLLAYTWVQEAEKLYSNTSP